ncbi:Nucleolar Complex 2 protein [Malassezia sp. CBS 17886]|nr:Nucleolar Complex 2 protein [Malassezia sp. CBS 17886]
MAKVTKRTRKFVKNKLDKTLQQRREQKKKGVHVRARAGRQEGRRAEGAGGAAESGDEEALDGDGAGNTDAKSSMSVDEFLRGGFRAGMEEEGEEGGEEEDSAAEDMLDEMDDIPEDEAHTQDLAQLAKKDPEFFKYLQENDKDLLAFGERDEDVEADDAAPESADESAEEAVPAVTKEMLRRWQRDLLTHYSLRALRRLLLAFRAAVHMGDADGEFAYTVDDSAVFTKLLITALKYTPMVLQHHAPYKKTAEGRFRVPTSAKKWPVLARCVRSYFGSVVHMLRTLPEADMVYVALTESAKMVPYVHQDRRMLRDYVRVLLQLWSSAADRVRLAAFSCLHLATASAYDEEMVDFCLKSTYHTLIRSTKLTTPHTMGNIQLMKNTAVALFALHPDASYQQAFGFIRQLAITLRNSLKLKTKEQYQAVLNWPYVHCLDFWSLVLAETCGGDVEAAAGAPSHMRPLVYPFVQVALGVARLLPLSRYFPLRVHIVHALLRVMQSTGVYVPLAPLLLEVFESAEFGRRAKGATLRPLDLDTTFRAPAAYARTRVYADQLADEFSYLLLEFLATQARSIAFPELVIPVTVQLRRTLKRSSNARLADALRPLLDKVHQNVSWVDARRQGVEFAPADQTQVDRFLCDGPSAKQEAPLQGALRLARKVREQKRKLLEQTAHVVQEDEA